MDDPSFKPHRRSSSRPHFGALPALLAGALLFAPAAHGAPTATAKGAAAPAATPAVAAAPTATPAPPFPSFDVIRERGGLAVMSSQRRLYRPAGDRRAGAADLDGTPVGRRAHFRAGSVTKMFVATAIMQQVERGTIGLDAPIERYLPGKLGYGKRVTVRQLLNHTSGLPAGGLIPIPSAATPREQLQAYVATPASPERLLAAAGQVTPKYEPGTQFEYSNINYTLAALVLESVTGKPFARTIEKDIIRPLGLRGTSFEDGVDLPAPFVRGYYSPTLVGEPADAPPVDVTRQGRGMFYGSGDLVSTNRDLTRFLAALQGGLLVQRETYAQMIEQTEVAGTYGLGLMSIPTPCGVIVGHAGSVPGYETMVATLGGRTISVAATAKPEPARFAGPSLSPEYVRFLFSVQDNALATLCPAYAGFAVDAQAARVIPAPLVETPAPLELKLAAGG